MLLRSIGIYKFYAITDDKGQTDVVVRRRGTPELMVVEQGFDSAAQAEARYAKLTNEDALYAALKAAMGESE